MCHSGSISQIIKPMEKEWHLDSRFLLLFFFPFLGIFFSSPVLSSLYWLTSCTQAVHLHSAEKQAVVHISPCSTWPPHPVSCCLSYSLGFSFLFWAFLCVTSQSTFCAYRCCFVNWWAGAENRPCWQKSEKSPSFRSIIPHVWITAILSKTVLTGQVQRDRTSPAASGASSQTHCPAISMSFSSFRDVDKDLKGGLYGLKTLHWSIHVHTVQGFHF